MKAGKDMNVGKRIKWRERKRERRWGERTTVGEKGQQWGRESNSGGEWREGSG